MKAFPSPYAVDEHGGMDLRDYFAAQAMQGMLSHSGILGKSYGKGADLDDANGAERAYKIADALMRARKLASSQGG